MTMFITVTKRDDDSYQASVKTVDNCLQGDPVKSEVAILRKAGDSVDVYCTDTRSIEITESKLDS